MIKKIIANLILGVLLMAPITCNAVANHMWCIRELNVDTSEKRWSHIYCEPNFLCYDNTTIEKENKYNPFGDKIITLWVVFCDYKTHHQEYDYIAKFNYEKGYPLMKRISFNLDKRTYKLQGQNQFTSIAPGSDYDKIIDFIKDVY